MAESRSSVVLIRPIRRFAKIRWKFSNKRSQWSFVLAVKFPPLEGNLRRLLDGLTGLIKQRWIKYFSHGLSSLP